MPNKQGLYKAVPFQGEGDGLYRAVPFRASHNVEDGPEVEVIRFFRRFKNGAMIPGAWKRHAAKVRPNA